MNFGEVLQQIELGSAMRRSNWREGTFIFKQVPACIPKTVVPNMQSLPVAVKMIFEARFNNESDQINAIYYSDQLAICDKSNMIKAYDPSVEDCFASDWEIY